MPDRGTLLSSQISAFLDNDPWNTTIVNNGSYIDIVQNVFYTRGQPALWFYAAAVSHCIASRAETHTLQRSTYPGLNTCLFVHDEFHHPLASRCALTPLYVHHHCDRSNIMVLSQTGSNGAQPSRV